MKKKIFIIITIILMFFLTGCKKPWEDKFELSDFRYEDSYIVGEIKNITNEDYIVTIKFKLSNGSIKEEDKSELYVPAHEKAKIREINTSVDSSYKIKVEDVTYEETKKIDMSKPQFIESDDLRLTFYDVGEIHADIKYSLSYEEASIFYSTATDTPSVLIEGSSAKYEITELYNAETQKIMVLRITSKDGPFPNYPTQYEHILQYISLYYYDEVIPYSDILKLEKVYNENSLESVGCFYITKEPTETGEVINIYLKDELPL